MYKLDDIKSIHLEITTKCQAKCPMCPRRIQGGRIMPFFDLVEITLDQFKEWIPAKIIKNLQVLLICGNLGDAIVAADTLEIIQYSRDINPKLDISFHTNGSARTKHWWKELAYTNTQVTFGIDGLEDTHSLYRVSTDFNDIIENATTFINAGGRAVWSMLVFEHNEHQIDECKKLSEKLGFEDFNVKHTTRFKNDYLNVLNDHGSTVHIIKPSKKSQAMFVKMDNAQKINNPTIQCKSVEWKQLYIGANGNVAPCCWLELEWRTPNDPGRNNYVDVIRDFPNLKQQSLEEIFKSGYFNRIKETWTNSPLNECARQCGVFDRLREQY
jgi:MoaA/NifB/PqqE/SkfB family radical SAM enzyme